MLSSNSSEDRNFKTFPKRLESLRANVFSILNDELVTMGSILDIRQYLCKFDIFLLHHNRNIRVLRWVPMKFLLGIYLFYDFFNCYV